MRVASPSGASGLWRSGFPGKLERVFHLSGCLKRRFSRCRIFSVEPCLPPEPTTFQSDCSELFVREPKLSDRGVSSTDSPLHSAGGLEFQIWLRPTGKPDHRAPTRG